MTTNFKDTVDRLQATMQKARDEAQNAFLEELKAIFVNNPDIAVIKWVQYTPYFNDGDTCEFSVHEVIASNYEEVSFWGEYEGEEDEPADLQIYNGYGVAKLISPELDALTSFMQSGLGHDVLQFAFGDHVSVTVTADGVEVDDYDHD
jgi:hypothetical protein